MKAEIKFWILCIFYTMLFSCKNQTEVNKNTVTEEEKYRPEIHFTPKKGWMNDPNGLIYYEGRYHLYYQHNPDSNVWGPMHWGHATTQDLVKWEHHPIAIYPDSIGTIFSGSMVLDSLNTAGFGHNAFVAIFTQHNHPKESKGDLNFQTQSIAYSTDGGMTFTKYKNNPVIKNPGLKDFRDPKVIWHAKSKKWILALAQYDKVKFYTSPNLKEWTYLSDFGIQGDTRLWECPDLFPLRVAGSNEEKWVLLVSIQKEAPAKGSGTSYFIGDFDGKTFKPTSKEQKWVDYGSDNYAMVSFHNSPTPLAIGWMSNWQYAQQVPTTAWRSSMTLPRRLQLINENGNYHLVQNIDKGIQSKIKTIEIQTKGSENQWKAPSMLHISGEVQKDITLVFSNESGESLQVGYDSGEKNFFIDRSKAGPGQFYSKFGTMHIAPASSNIVKTVDMEIYIDKTSIELIANGGKTVMTDIFFPTQPFSKVERK